MKCCRLRSLTTTIQPGWFAVGRVHREPVCKSLRTLSAAINAAVKFACRAKMYSGWPSATSFKTGLQPLQYTAQGHDSSGKSTTDPILLQPCCRFCMLVIQSEI
mmetsp:Transcript_22002/g.41432  ORF Transcript_22002/g.41432 Transcript_22002/m.41432 type:complete len:104 (+) Transcript_22002:60-371(+)